ncbi:MAG: UvrD-helicase domain-containing protein, partial [Chlamydiia bacterium]|nr:UvrD-helicase domain-containing protein [Chlamydiia bacterium]
MMDLTQLNKEQREAVETIDGPLLILAGAGSGKTRVVTHRIVHLIESGVPPWAILGLTFTNKAAGEMRERVESLCDQRVLISTFHSLGVRILRESIGLLGYPPSFSIYDEEDALKLIRVCLGELEMRESKGMVKEIKQAISRAKNQLLGPTDVVSEEEWATVYSRYQEKLRECHAVDFDDLLFLTVKLFQEHPE